MVLDTKIFTKFYIPVAIETRVVNRLEFFEHHRWSFMQGSYLPSLISPDLVVKEDMFKVKI